VSTTFLVINLDSAKSREKDNNDDATTWTGINFLKRKSQTAKSYSEFKAWAKTQLMDELKQDGTIRTLTVHDTPEQNGISERTNLTIVSNAHAMLAQSGLPKFLWAKAISHGVWLKNRSPARALINKTPHEAAGFGKPDLSDLHEFGATVYVLNDGRKLDDRGLEAKFVGYDSERKGYRIYWPKKRSVTVERNVKFHANEVVIPETVQDEGEKVNNSTTNAQKASERTKTPTESASESDDPDLQFT
jgi:hypothetical protein